jgi:ribosomal protein S18 acetylase RimI-like enzyme
MEEMSLIIKSSNGCHYNFWPEKHVGSAVGSFDLFMRSDRPCELWSFGIKKDERGKGYGQQMLREAIAMVGEHDIVLYVMKCNDLAIHIYEKAGFEIAGNYPLGDYAWRMIRKAEQAEMAESRQAASFV